VKWIACRSVLDRRSSSGGATTPAAESTVSSVGIASRHVRTTLATPSSPSSMSSGTSSAPETMSSTKTPRSTASTGVADLGEVTGRDRQRHLRVRVREQRPDPLYHRHAGLDHLELLGLPLHPREALL